MTETSFEQVTRRGLIDRHADAETSPNARSAESEKSAVKSAVVTDGMNGNWGVSEGQPPSRWHVGNTQESPRFAAIYDENGQKIEVVRAGVEPATHGFSVVEYRTLESNLSASTEATYVNTSIAALDPMQQKTQHSGQNPVLELVLPTQLLEVIDSWEALSSDAVASVMATIRDYLQSRKPSAIDEAQQSAAQVVSDTTID